MKISANQGSPLRLPSLADGARRIQVRSAEVQGVRARGDRVELSDRDGDGDEVAGQSPSERVSALGEKVHDRLSQLARKTGLDLSDIEASFDKNMERLQSALADGTLSREGLTRGVGNLLDGLRSDLSARLSEGTKGAESRGASPGERAEALAETTLDRFRSLIREQGGNEGLEKAMDAFGEHMDRLLAGIEDGSLDARGIASGIQSILDLARQDVARAMPTEPEASPDASRNDQSAPADPQSRFESFVAGIESRLEGIDASPAQSRALEELKQQFAQSMGRLDKAFFEEGAFDREKFGDLLGSLMNGLREDVKGLFGGDSGAANRASLYNPRTGLEQLGGDLPGGLDTTI